MAHIDENTKIMARLHTGLNNRGLHTYNTYFEQSSCNAIYALFNNEDIEPLVRGIRDLKLAGGIAAGFEHDEKLAGLLDELDGTAKAVGRVGIIINDNGKLIGYSQGGYGLLNSILDGGPIDDGEQVVILGSGMVARGLLYAMEQEGLKPAVTLINRTKANAEKLAKDFPGIVVGVRDFEELNEAKGSTFINTSHIGAPWHAIEYDFDVEFLRGFRRVADVAFVPLKPQLVLAAEEAGCESILPGSNMFMHQAAICLEKILGHKMNQELYEPIMLQDFENNWS